MFHPLSYGTHNHIYCYVGTHNHIYCDVYYNLLLFLEQFSASFLLASSTVLKQHFQFHVVMPSIKTFPHTERFFFSGALLL